MSKRLIKTSRFLSLVLRHRPELVGLTLDTGGWAPTAELIRGTEAAGRPLTPDELEWIVANDEKRRYSFNDDRSRIRANYGHSVRVELDFGYVTDSPQPCSRGDCVIDCAVPRSSGAVKSRYAEP